MSARILAAYAVASAVAFATVGVAFPMLTQAWTLTLKGRDLDLLALAALDLAGIAVRTRLRSGPC